MIETPAQREARLQQEYGLLQESLALNWILLQRLIQCESDAALRRNYAALAIGVGDIRAAVRS